MSIETAYDRTKALVAKFKALSAAARRQYNEDNTRKDFIMPLFEALEWDTRDSREVSAEDRVSRGWVDFAFRIGGIVRFFLETKRIAEDLARAEWVKQTIDYAWTKSVTWAVLSDFEGLRVFNAEWKEANPQLAQFIEFSVDTYLSDFERLWWLSRPEMAAGRLNLEAEKYGKKARREPVSKHLFDDLRLWRHELVRHLRVYNQMWSPAQIDEAVLVFLNRMIFLRTAEDREVEPRRLQALARELRDSRRIQQLLPELRKLFRDLDQAYDSQFFAPHLADDLDCDPGPFETLIDGLYGKQYMLYNFNAIDADVLGTVYEQYLGHVISGREATDDVERRAKRKSQGIYYTPAYIVKYIVQQTLGRYLQENEYSRSRPVRVLDMACGSGSFLIEAFDVLDRSVAQQLGQTDAVEPIFDRARQTELLQNCIFGVDKDEQAVSVARLNLLLRALHSRERLPMLDNIRCGDSLISGSADELRAAFGDDWRAKKPFDWQTEFPSIMQSGGFDIIIGNPPYVRAENMPRDERDYYIESRDFHTSYGRFDIHVLFVERALGMLKEGGRLGFIIPFAGLTQNYGQAMRDLMLATCIVESIVDLSDYKAFADASVGTCIVVLRKESRVNERHSHRVSVVKQLRYDHGIGDEGVHIEQSTFFTTPHRAFRLDLTSIMSMLTSKVRDQSFPLGQICYLITGAVLHDPKTGASKDRLIHDHMVSGHKQYIEAKELSRYLPPHSTRYLDYSRPQGMHRPKFPELFERDKLMLARIANRVIATLDTSGIYTDHTVNLAVRKDLLVGVRNRSVRITEQEAEQARHYDIRYVLGMINSAVATFYLRRLLGMAIEINPETARGLPIRVIDFADSADRARHDRIVTLVDEMLALQKEHAEAERAREDKRHELKRRIEAVDAAIDQLVYELYGLTEEETAIVEGR